MKKTFYCEAAYAIGLACLALSTALMATADFGLSMVVAPAYILHTSNDQVVDVRHSLLLASAFKAAGKEFEMHIYPDAPHGVALGNRITRCWEAKFDNPAIAKWVENAAVWTDSL